MLRGWRGGAGLWVCGGAGQLLFYCCFDGVVWQLWWFFMAACRLWCMACSGGKKRNKSAHYAQKCAISYVMLLNFLAYMHFCGARACIFLKRPYLCIVFFIVLDLRLTRLGYSGIPFFLSLCQDAPLREAWKTHVPPRKIICSERFFALPLLVGGMACIFLLFFLLIFPTRDASPPLELAFGACVGC